MTSQKNTSKKSRSKSSARYSKAGLPSLLISVGIVLVTMVIVEGVGPFQQVQAHPSTFRTDTWVVDDKVLDITVDGDNYFLAGEFENTNEFTGTGAAFSKTTHELSDSVRTHLEAATNVAIPDGSGGWFVGGDFGEVDNVYYGGLVHLEADGSITTTWTPEVAGFVRDLYLDGTTLYVVGSFTNVLGGTGPFRRRAAAFDVSDLTTVSLLDWDPNLESHVYSVGKYGSYVYLGGAFNWVNSSSFTANSGLAAVDPITGAVEPNWTVNSDNINDFEIASDGSVMYVGGSFTTIDGVLRDDGAAISLADGVSDVTVYAWNPDFLGSINTVQLSGDESTVFMGGSFSKVRQGQLNEFTTSNLVALSADETDETTSPITTWAPNASGNILSINLDGNTLYAAGNFATIGGVSRRTVADIDVSDLSSVSVGTLSLLPPGGLSTNYVGISTDELFLGGDWHQIGGVPRNLVAQYDINTNQPTSLDLNIVGTSVERLLVVNNILFIGGNFTSVLGQARDDLAAVDLSTVSLLSWDPTASGGSGGGHVYELERDGNTMYVGGNFGLISGESRLRIAAYDITDPSNPSLLPFNPGANNQVSEIETDTSRIYVAGQFIQAGNNGGTPGSAARNKLAAIDKATGEADLTWVQPDNGVVTTMEISDDKQTLYLGGTFTTIDAVSRRAAGINVSTGQLTSWAPTLNNAVRTMTLDVNVIYIAGDFTNCDGSVQRVCAYEYDGTLASWSPSLGSGISGARAPIIRQNGRLHLGGAFIQASGLRWQGYVQFTLTQVGFTEAASSAPEVDPSTTFMAEATQPDTVSATLAVVGGTASSGTDFTLLTTTVNFTPGDSTADVSVDLDNDFIAEDPETAIVEITEISANGVPGSVTTHTLTIVDDDIAGGALSESAVTSTEGSTDGTYTVQLTSQPLNDVTVSVGVADPAQVSVSPSALTFTDATWNTPQTVTVIAVDDTDVDGTATVDLSHSASSADPMYEGLDIGTVTVSALDNDGSGGTTPGVTVIDGADPTTQAIEVSKTRFDSDGSANGVALARSDIAVDSLTVGPFVNLKGYSLLLTPSTSLSQATLTEMNRVLGDTSKPVYLVGGTEAISDQVQNSLVDNGYNSVMRFAGVNRRDTAKLIGNAIVSDSIGPVTSVFLADDDQFVDALTVGAEAGRVVSGAVKPILLSGRGKPNLDGSVQTFLSENSQITSVVLVGGPAALSSQLESVFATAFPSISVNRLGGQDRFETNAIIAATYFADPAVVYVARGDKPALPGSGQLAATSASAAFYGALFAGTLGAENYGPVLLITPDQVPVPIADYMTDNAASIEEAILVVDQASISQGVLDRIGELLI